MVATPPPDPPLGSPVTSEGMTLRRAWPVWSNQVQHRVDVAINALTGSTRISVDGTEAARRSMWHMDPSGFELPFEVDGRPCLLVVRTRYGAQTEFELYSEGRSLSTGEELAQHRDAASREMPNLIRMLLIFIPLIGGFNTVIQQRNGLSGALGGWGPWLLVGFGIAVAAAAWWLASRWYARGPDTPNRHLVGGGIVAAAWIAFFAGLVAVLSLRPV